MDTKKGTGQKSIFEKTTEISLFFNISNKKWIAVLFPTHAMP